MYRIKTLSFVLLASPFAVTPLHAQRRSSDSHSATPAADSVAVVGTANRFHEALSSGDTLLVKQLLAPDLIVLEAGAVETRKEYLAHHLAADVEFAKALPSHRTVTSYTREGNSVWLASTSVTRGQFHGRDVSSVGAELMILTRAPKGWQIRAVHWSSARR